MNEYYEYLKKTYGEAVANRYQQVTFNPPDPSPKKSRRSSYSVYVPAPDEAIGKRVRIKRRVYYEWDGLLLSAREWAERLGIALPAFYRRLHFWGLYAPTFTRGNSHKNRHNRTKVYTYNGKSLTAEEWSKVLDIAVITFYHRVRRYPTNHAKIFYRGELPRGRAGARFRI